MNYELWFITISILIYCEINAAILPAPLFSRFFAGVLSLLHPGFLFVYHHIGHL